MLCAPDVVMLMVTLSCRRHGVSMMPPPPRGLRPDTDPGAEDITQVLT